MNISICIGVSERVTHDIWAGLLPRGPVTHTHLQFLFSTPKTGMPHAIKWSVSAFTDIFKDVILPISGQ